MEGRRDLGPFYRGDITGDALGVPERAPLPPAKNDIGPFYRGDITGAAVGELATLAHSNEVADSTETDAGEITEEGIDE